MARNREGYLVCLGSVAYSSQPSSGWGCSCVWCGDKSRANVAGWYRDMLEVLSQSEEVSCLYSPAAGLLDRSWCYINKATLDSHAPSWRQDDCASPLTYLAGCWGFEETQRVVSSGVGCQARERFVQCQDMGGRFALWFLSIQDLSTSPRSSS